MWVYAVMCVAWAWHIHKTAEPLKNWQWLLSWTMFLPVVLIAMMWAGISCAISWLKQES